MKKIILAAWVLVFAGCATSTGVLPLRPDVYTVTWEGGSAASQPADLRASAIREADQFCAKNGKQVDVVRTNEVGLGFLRQRRVDLEFKCSGEFDPARLPAQAAAPASAPTEKPFHPGGL